MVSGGSNEPCKRSTDGQWLHWVPDRWAAKVYFFVSKSHISSKRGFWFLCQQNVYFVKIGFDLFFNKNGFQKMIWLLCKSSISHYQGKTGFSAYLVLHGGSFLRYFVQTFFWNSSNVYKLLNTLQKIFTDSLTHGIRVFKCIRCICSVTWLRSF